ncbi:ArsR/SmtB family transcription factor [Psychrobacter lutiphocae]|uniref:ArsR/SmtB family transcription factor n=1 Tax=Psychrobacter lutiphocae TaxID=540500 RepID=UPI000368D2CD|nr:metalloregulator ArsR/SmtB family transcription factor [Psychrobacter lutiphocae]
MNIDQIPTCHSDDHHPPKLTTVELSDAQHKQVTLMLKALADSQRLQMVLLLKDAEEVCVSEIAKITGDKMSTLSNRLKQLHEAGLINKRREAQHIYYSLQDEHVRHLIDNLVTHAKHL